MADPAGVLDDVIESLSMLTAAVGDLSTDECSMVLAGLQRISNIGQQLQRQVIDRAALRGEWLDDGFRSVVRWAVVTADLPERAARRLHREAAVLRDLQHASAAASAGRLHDVHIEQIVACERAAPEQYSPEIDAAFTRLACAGQLGDFAVAVREWKARAEAGDGPDGPDPVHRPEAASLHISETIDGRWVGNFLLAPQDGQLVAAELSRLVGGMLQRKRDGDVSYQRLDTAAMRAQALVDIIDRAKRLNAHHANAPDRYHVITTIDLDTFATAIGHHRCRCGDPGGGGPDDRDDDRRRRTTPSGTSPSTDPAERACSTDHGGSIHPHAPALTWRPPPGSTTSDGWPAPGLPVEGLCDCTLVRLVMGAHREPLDVGRATRTWPAPMRTAITQRDGGCRFPRCTEPIAHCDVHHCTHWQHHGPTAVTNGITLCRWHHTYLHANKWRVALDRHQRPTFYRPDGTIYDPMRRARPDPRTIVRSAGRDPRSTAPLEMSRVGGGGRAQWIGLR